MCPRIIIAALCCSPALLVTSCTSSPGTKPQVANADTAVLELLAQSTGHTVLSRQTVIRFGVTQPKDTLRMNGIIIPDERRTNKIAARFGGRIEKLYVRFPFQYVGKGEKLLDLYSPELNASISEYLFLRAKDSLSVLTAQAKQKLVLLGLTGSQLDQFVKAGKVPPSVSIYASYEGYVLPFDTPSNAANAMTGNNSSNPGMSSMGQTGNNNAATASTNSSAIREGAYISAGQTLFAINDAKEIIASFSISSAAFSSMQTGIMVNVKSELSPGQSISGSVQLIEPIFESGQRFVSVRVPLTNATGILKFNSLVTGELQHTSTSVYAIPSSCVYDLGERKIVWVKTGEADHVPFFTPRIITTGTDDGQNTEVLSGLQPGEEIAQDAGLMVDREGIIQIKQP